jgi:nucleoside-diphosphate-sugar epimerase
VIPNFITAALERKPVTVFGDGERSRDFTYVDNVVEGNVLAMSAAGVSGQMFNIACGDRITLNKLVASVGRLLGRSLEVNHAPPRPGRHTAFDGDVSLARAELGYEVVVGFEEGLARTIERYVGAANAPARVEA